MILKPMECLPAGAYAPLEQPPAGSPTRKFLGGLGTVWIVRYTSSPIGPYDELLYAPGDFETPSGGKATSITRIYVSTAVSVYNGRKIWNIPKHLARFSFVPLGANRTQIEVSDYYGDGDAAPFFAAIATPQRFVPALPFATRWLRVPPTPHPPLPAGPADRPEEVGTEEWRAVAQDTRGNVKLVWWEPLPPRAGGAIPAGQYSDGKRFPRIDIRGFGVWFMPGMTLEFGPALPVTCPEA